MEWRFEGYSVVLTGCVFEDRYDCCVRKGESPHGWGGLAWQPRIDWCGQLDRLLRRAHPLHAQFFRDAGGVDYYWTSEQTEWATDVVFRDAARLGELYPTLLRRGIDTFQSPDVLRFLGHRVPQHGGVHGNFQGAVQSDLKRRAEGVRIKHRVGKNTVKMYNKEPTVLRVETTLNDTRGLKTYRPKQGDPEGACAWQDLRKSVADLPRRVELSQGVARGEHLVTGFRNRDLRIALYGQTESSEERRREAARISRKLAMLRAHGLIKKIPRTHRYVLTNDGGTAIAAILAARQSPLSRLTAA